MKLDVVAQWVHLAAAVAAVGGVLYVRVVLMKSLRALPPEHAPLVLKAAGRRFHPLLWTAIALLFVSGLYNVAIAAARGVADPLYWRLLGVKVLLALVLFALALAVTVPTPALANFQRRRPQVLAVNLVLAAVILYLSAYLRRL